MMPERLCNFCQNKTDHVPLSVGKSMPGIVRILNVYFCRSCSAEYVHWNTDGELAAMHIYTTINNKMYRWSVQDNILTAQLWFIEEPGIPGIEPNRKVQLLQSFDDYPEITPQNIEEKIKFMLLYL